MARKNNGLSKKQQDRKSAILRHAYALNLYSINDYLEWCLQQGFRANTNKTTVQVKHEYQHYLLISATKKLKQAKHEGNMHSFINKIYTNKVKYKDLNGETLKTIYKGFNKTKNKRLLRDVLLQMDENTKLLTHIDYVTGVINFVEHFPKWLQPITNWQPKTHNAGRQFASLARFLFARYDVPAFMDSVWLKDKSSARNWFIQIGTGKNIAKASSLPINMTKKMAHYFLQAPANYDVNAAFRWAQIHALGGNKVIADAIAETRVAQEFNNEEFWLSVLRFFIANPMLDTNQFAPIIDYIWHKKYENRMVFVERGIVHEEGPEQPNFSMRERTADTLLRNVEDWHRQLGKESRGGNLQWVKSTFSELRYTEGHSKKRNMKIWTIQELLSNKELIAEGRKQNHCVSTYARSCFSGTTSIWTMDVQESDTRQKLLTIEVHNASKTIRQIRGLRNRLAKDGEMLVIRRWAAQEGLKISAYI